LRRCAKGKVCDSSKILEKKNVPDDFNSEKAKRLKSVHKVSPQLSYYEPEELNL
jgi:hypothetical protein